MSTPDSSLSERTFGPLLVRWSRLTARDKTLLGMAAALVVLTLLWLLLLAPALRTLRAAPAQARSLDAQLQTMLTLQSQARDLQKQEPLAYADALRALNLATRQTLGATAQTSVSAERAQVTLQAASADALAQWLAQARLNARSVPLEARLTRSNAAGTTTWTGVLVMRLPQR